MLLTNFTEAVNDVINPGLLSKYFEDFPNKAIRVGIRVALSLIVFIIGINLIKLVRKILKKSLQKAKADKGVTGFLDSLIKVTLYIILVFVIATLFGFDAAGISALLASAGVTVGLALQGSLSNLAGGVLILINKPFTIGDYIVAASSGKEGVVKEIQICYTKLLTVDNQLVILPNGSLANGAITNVTKEPIRRIDINASIAYSADIDKARKVLVEMMDADSCILQDKEKSVYVSNLADSGIEIIVRFWVKAKDYWDTKFRITENTKKTLDSAGVEIPFPQVDVHMK